MGFFLDTHNRECGFGGHFWVNTSCWKRYEGIYIFYPVDIPLNLIGVINQYVLLHQSPLQQGMQCLHVAEV